jgi:protein-L-isoaspartate(D-aspartate) O-methyltransferase
MELILLDLTLLSLFLWTNFFIEDNDEYANKRWDMVERQLISRGIQNSKVIRAMIKIPRHKFVPENLKDSAYEDSPLPIGMEQTISQPYIVALMTELLNLKEADRVLEVGTGSGYQTAIIAEIGCEVYTVEILEPVAEKAKRVLQSLGYKNIHFKIGDGYRGWEEHAPFDAIIVTAAPEHMPQPLLDQLKVKGKMIIPVGALYQDLLLVRRTEKGVDMKTVTPVRFVPMTGEAGRSGDN